MRRLLSLLKLILILTLLMFLSWYLSARFLPNEVLHSYFSHIFEVNPITNGKFTFWGIFVSNFVIGFVGIQFMNLFKVKKIPGGLFILPLFWIIYGVLLGTNSFIYAKDSIPFSISVLWERTGFNELVAYTFGYVATYNWALWEQQSLWGAYRIPNKRWKPQKQDVIYWCIGLFLLVIAMIREMS